MTVMAAHPWANNGELIADVARLGYLHEDWLTLDVTYGTGRFWSKFRPRRLVASDLYAEGAMHHWDFTALPVGTGDYKVVVLDPPYKLNGTSTGEGPSALDAGYGVSGKYVAWQDRHALIRRGIREAMRVTTSGGFVLVKCQDQVCSGAIRWQTREFADFGEMEGATLVDRFDMIGRMRKQPMEAKVDAKGTVVRAAREQRHAHGRPSTLLVFRRT